MAMATILGLRHFVRRFNSVRRGNITGGIYPQKWGLLSNKYLGPPVINICQGWDGPATMKYEEMEGL